MYGDYLVLCGNGVGTVWKTGCRTGSDPGAQLARPGRASASPDFARTSQRRVEGIDWGSPRVG